MSVCYHSFITHVSALLPTVFMHCHGFASVTANVHLFAVFTKVEQYKHLVNEAFD